MTDAIISVSGLRGVIGLSLDPILAIKYAVAFSRELDDGPIVVTRDGRTTGEVLAYAIGSGLAAAGRDVLYGDVAATPTTGVLVREHEAAGGIQISASHNPPEYNGIKLFGNDGRVISANRGDVVRQHFWHESPDWVDHSQFGQLHRLADTTSTHLEKVLATIDPDLIRARQFRVLLDSNHGAGSVLAKPLLRSLGVDAVFLGDTPDGLFEHPPEPTRQNLERVSQRAAAGSFDVTFAQDPDADRLAVIDEKGNYIGEELTLAITLDHALSQNPGAAVINCATSRLAMDIARKYGGRCHLSAVGEANVCDAMVAHDAVYGGEGNGGPIDPRVGYVRDSFVAMAQILDKLASSDSTVSQLVESLPKYAIEKLAVDVSGLNLQNVLQAVKCLYPDAQASELDGLRLDWDDRWLLVRASNTEPIVRVIAEATHPQVAKHLCLQIKNLIEDRR